MESELVAGFFTEHSSVPFVFFFLAEYSSIVLFSSISSILFLGGYNLPDIFGPSLSAAQQGNVLTHNLLNIAGLWPAVILGLKTCLFCFIFVWFRATLPRLRFDQLSTFC